MVTKCTFTNNTATKERGGAIYNYEGTLKIANSRFEKNSKYEKAIYNYGDEDNPFRLTIINTTMVEDKVTVNFNDNERRLDDKRDIDLLTTEVNAYISEIIYDGTPVLIGVSGIDEDFTGSITVNITNTIYNTFIDVSNGEGNTTMNLDINRYTARLKNFISLTEDAFERDDTKPYLEINFKVASNNSFSAFDDMISKATNNVTLNHDYVFDSKTDAAYIRIVDKALTIYGNGYSINGNGASGDTLFLIEDDSDVRMENITLENGRAQSRSHLGSQIRMGGAIYVSRSTLTLINSTLKNNKAQGGSGGAIYSDFSTLNIIGTNFTNNDASNGKNLYIQGGNGVYILNSIIDEKDIYNEPDWDNDDMLARISVFNDLNAALHISDHVCDDDELIEITGPENFTGIADLTINGNQINNIQITCGHAFFRLNLAPGSYVATMATPDTEYYRDDGRNLTCTYLSATTTSNEFKVLRKANIELTIENIVYGENETINVNIDAEGNVTIVLDGRTVEYGLIINNNEIAYTIPKHYLNAGNHAVEVRYNGDTYVICCSKSVEFTVNKTDSSLSVGDVVLEYGNSIKVNVTVEGAKGIVAEIDNKNVNVNGFSVPISGLDVGTHTLSVTAIADANHNNMTKTATINVIKLKTELAANTVVATYNIDKNLVITLKDSNGNALKGVKISVYIKGDKKYTTDKNGQVKINVANLVPKIYAAKISFAGNINYKASSKSVKVTVKKGNTKLIASSKSFTVKATKKVTAILKDSKNRIIKNRYVTFKVAGKSYKVKTDSKGVATATVKLIKKGSFSTVVSFAGDNCYNKCEKTIKVTVK